MTGALSSAVTYADSDVYEVKPGDSLSGIALQLDVSLSSLVAVNRMTVSSLIVPGQRLVVPAGASGDVSGGSGGRYTVRAGDTLGGIAARHRVSLSSLLAVNRMTVSSLIMPGMKLALPAGASVASVPTGGPVDVVLDYAKAQLGKPYAFFTAGPDRFDCSGLTLAAYARIGISLVHHSAAQARQGTGVNFLHTAIRPGDLVFMDTNGDGTINHVGIAINATTLIQTPGPGDAVRLTPMPAKSAIVAVRRLVPSN
jgi:peptidoglycan DL-endopeptidase LytE